jgi:hypothetical protein
MVFAGLDVVVPEVERLFVLANGAYARGRHTSSFLNPAPEVPIVPPPRDAKWTTGDPRPLR